MAARKRHSFLTLFLILVLCVNLLNAQAVRADGETPTEPPVATQVETEPPTAEVTEEPTEVPTEAPTQVPTDVPTEVPAQETPTPVDSVPTPVPTEAEETPTPIAEILTQVPQETDVVVIDETGTPMPLASEEAAEIVEGFDPMWCPAGVLPGGPGCTTNFASISALITDMINNTGTYTQNGIIYFVATTGSQTTGASLNLTTSGLGGSNDFNLINDFNLTLQGGWNGANGGSATFAGTTNFGNYSLSVGSSGNPWAGNVSINNMSFNGVSSSNAVTVYTTAGNISLGNVDVSQQSGGNYAAFLNSGSGNITIENGSSFDGNTSNQSEGVSATTATGSITISDTTFTESAQNGSNTNNGATLSASTVTLTNVTATGSDGNGIEINNASLVTLNNVTASNNGTASGGPGLPGNSGSGVFVNGTSGSSVIVNGGTFNSNAEYGIELGSPANTTIYVQATPTCTGNVGGCYNETPVLDNTPPVITPTIDGLAGANGWYTSNVNVTWDVSDAESGIKTQSGCTASNLTAETSGLTLTCEATNNVNLSSSVDVVIKIDQGNPSITYTGRTVPNSNSWNNTNVTANWTCSDSFSGPASDTVNQTVTTEGAGQSATGTCFDLAGNTASDTQGGINIDKTAPSLSLPSGVTAEATSNAGAAVTYSATVSDNLDPNVTLSCAPASGSNFAMGLTKVACSSTDQADNTANGDFLVEVGDTAGPVIASHPDVTAEATSASGATVSYTNPTATDAVDGPVSVTCTPASGGTFPLGDSAITCNASDSQGNQAEASSFVIHVVDTTGPVIAAHADITVEATSATNTVVTYANPTATDLVDGSVAVTCSPASGATFALGDTTVTCNAIDASGNAAGPVTFTVHVIDTTIPVIDFHADLTVEATSPSGVTVTYTNPPATDLVDGPVAVTCSPAPNTLFALGDTTVTCNASDSSGNAAQPTTFVVHVVDTTGPVIADHADVTAQATSINGAVVNYTSPSTSDAVDGPGTATCLPASGEQFPMSDTTVTCTAVDSHGNEASPTTFVIHVVDSGGPVIEAHADVTAQAASSSGATVNYTNPAATDVVDGPVPVSCLPASGTTFVLGDTTVTCEAEDSVGNKSTSSFVVHVVDTLPPSIADHADLTAEAETDAGVFVGYTTPTANDLVDGSVPVTCSPASNTLFALGDTTVTCEATDQHENTATSTFVVHVVDTTAPVIAAHGDETAEATSPAGAVVTYNTPSASDAVDTPITVTCTPASGTVFAVGNTQVTCNAMDTSGNNAKPVTFTVHVVDTTAPTLSLPNNITTNATDPAGAVVTFTASGTDTVDQNVAVTCSPASGSTFPLGSNPVTCTAADDHNNTTEGTFFVNVMDPGGPILSLPDNLIVEATSSSGATVTFSATAVDIVDGNVPVECTPASGSTFGFGTTTVTCIAWDSSEHSNEGSFLVTVQDTTAPAIAPHADINIEVSSAVSTIVTYTSPSTTDAVDGAGIATCTPASGSLFPMGETTVTCTATDAHGNTSTSTFSVHVKLSKPGTPETPGTTMPGVLVPITGGELMDLDCNSVLWAFGIKLSFFNLCDYQTAIHSVGAGDLPGDLPEGFSYVMGLDVDILSAGQFIQELPDGTGIEMDFPIYEQSPDQFVVLFWSETDGKWIEVSQQISADELSQTLNAEAESELYQVLTESLSDLFHQILTAQKTGIFILVKK